LAGLLLSGPDCLAEPDTRSRQEALAATRLLEPVPVRFTGLGPGPGRLAVPDTAAPRLEVRSSAGGLGDPSLFLPRYETSNRDLLRRYRRALEKESLRAYDKNPSVFVVLDDAEGYPLDSAHRSARRIFGKANSRMLSGYLEEMIEGSASLRNARNYVEGIRVDVRKGGDVRFGPGEPEDESAVRASFHLVALGDPRLEMRTKLPGGVESRVELSLTSPGVRTKLHCRFGSRLTGSLSGGVEDSGEDRWIAAGLGIRF